MVSYKYKLYNSKHNKHLSAMLMDASFVWNHCLALHKRYYRMFGKFINANRLKTHFAKRYRMQRLHSQTVQEVIERLDTAYRRFFDHIAKRPPKFKRAKDFTSIVFKQGGYKIEENRLTINKIGKTFRFFLSRPYEGAIKRLVVKRDAIGDFYIVLVLDRPVTTYEKTHNGASVGVDFGLKTYMTLSDGSRIDNPRFLRRDLNKLKRASLRLSLSKKGGHNHEHRRKELDRIHRRIRDRRSDFQWKLAHKLCRRYDIICLEDLNLSGMTRLWGRKMNDLAHAEFVNKLEYVATKYGVTVHKVDRYFPSSKLCSCGHVYKSLKLSDRSWVCPCCGEIHDRDLWASQNILRQGIADLESGSKTSKAMRGSNRVRIQESR